MDVQAGLSRQKSVMVITAPTVPDYNTHEWYIGGTNRRDAFEIRSFPNYKAEIDGYKVILYLGNSSTYMDFPEAYKTYVQKQIVDVLEETSAKKQQLPRGKFTLVTEYDDRPLEKYTHW
jgi:hypothetical protein